MILKKMFRRNSISKSNNPKVQRVISIVGLVFAVIVQIACIVLCFAIKDDTIASLNRSGLTQLVSLLFLAPLFTLPLFTSMAISFGYIVRGIIKKQWAVFSLQLILILPTIYLAVDFFSKVNLK